MSFLPTAKGLVFTIVMYQKLFELAPCNLILNRFAYGIWRLYLFMRWPYPAFCFTIISSDA